MSKLFKILISLIVICLTSVAFFACKIDKPAKPESTLESVIESMPESEPESEEEPESEPEEDTESNFEVELPEVDRM